MAGPARMPMPPITAMAAASKLEAHREGSRVDVRERIGVDATADAREEARHAKRLELRAGGRDGEGPRRLLVVAHGPHAPADAARPHVPRQPQAHEEDGQAKTS